MNALIFSVFNFYTAPRKFCDKVNIDFFTHGGVLNNWTKFGQYRRCRPISYGSTAKSFIEQICQTIHTLYTESDKNVTLFTTHSH